MKANDARCFVQRRDALLRQCADHLIFDASTTQLRQPKASQRGEVPQASSVASVRSNMSIVRTSNIQGNIHSRLVPRLTMSLSPQSELLLCHLNRGRGVARARAGLSRSAVW